MKLSTFLLVMSFLKWTSAVELKHKQVIKVKNKSYTCLFNLHYEGDVCFKDSTVTCTPNIRKKAVAKNIKLVLKDGTVMIITKIEISKKKDKMTGCKVTRPTPPTTIQPTTVCGGKDSDCCTPSTPCGHNDGDCDLDQDCLPGLVCGRNNCPNKGSSIPDENTWDETDDCCTIPECHSENSKWKNGIQQLELFGGESLEQSWKACGTKCSINDDCHLWQYSENTSMCWNFAEKGNAEMAVGDDITGRKGCPAELINRTVTCGFNDDELAGGVRSPVDPHPGYKWAGGIIPYFFTNSVTYNDKEVFYNAMGQIHRRTCFSFQETAYSGFRGHHLQIDVGRGTCWPSSSAYVKIDPYNNNKMLLKSKYQLADQGRCHWEGLILHELMHVLGVMHTQKRRDRNNYITVHYHNIYYGGWSQYDICYNCRVYNSIPYECQSIMHYGTKNQRIPGRGRTMTPKNPSTCRLYNYGPSVATANDWNLLRIIASDVCSQGSGCTFKDKYPTSYCEYWKSFGDCTSSWSIRFMNTYCAKTCKCNSG